MEDERMETQADTREMGKKQIKMEELNELKNGKASRIDKITPGYECGGVRNIHIQPRNLEAYEMWIYRKMLRAPWSKSKIIWPTQIDMDFC